MFNTDKIRLLVVQCKKNNVWSHVINKLFSLDKHYSRNIVLLCQPSNLCKKRTTPRKMFSFQSYPCFIASCLTL